MTEIPGGLRRCLLFASVFVVTVALWAATGTAAAQSAPDCSTVTYNGTRTTYEISNLDQLQCIESQGLFASYVVVSDINASETATWNGGKGFNPIDEFSGNFSGGNHNIMNLTIDRDNEAGVGLFGNVDGGGGITSTITNVSVVNVSINGSGRVGGLVGFNDEGVIKNSYANGSIDGSSLVGGLVGYNDEGTIKRSHARVSVDASEEVGGLVGLKDEGTLNESYATGSVNGSQLVGGLVGSNLEGTIKRSHAKVSVNGIERVGGLVGVNRGTIKGSYATGSVNGSKRVGGLAGRNTVGTIRKSYARGSVTGSSSVGGLVGEDFDGTIKETYATGSVGCSSGDCDVSGLVAGGSGGTFTGLYWDINATGQTHGDFVGTGLTTAEMTGSAARGNMTGFDFTNTWKTVPGDYPVLRKDAYLGDGTKERKTETLLVLIVVLAILTVIAAIREKRK